MSREHSDNHHSDNHILGIGQSDRKENIKEVLVLMDIMLMILIILILAGIVGVCVYAGVHIIRGFKESKEYNEMEMPEVSASAVPDKSESLDDIDLDSYKAASQPAIVPVDDGVEMPVIPVAPIQDTVTPSLGQDAVPVAGDAAGILPTDDAYHDAAASVDHTASADNGTVLESVDYSVTGTDGMPVPVSSTDAGQTDDSWGPQHGGTGMSDMMSVLDDAARHGIDAFAGDGGDIVTGSNGRYTHQGDRFTMPSMTMPTLGKDSSDDVGMPAPNDSGPNPFAW